MSGDKGAWVVKRFKCTIPVALEAIHECAEAAITRANQLVSEDTKDFKFELVDATNGGFSVRGWPMGSPIDCSAPRKVVIEKTRDNGIAISSTVERSLPMKVNQRWNVREERCSLHLGDGDESEEYTPEQIAQLALEPLFFA